MIIEGCAKGVVLLLLVSSSFSQSMDDASKMMDVAVDDPAWTSAQHQSRDGVGGRLRRWNSDPEDSVELQNAASIEDEERINEKGLEGVNATNDVKESKDGFGWLIPNPFRPQSLFQIFATTAAPTTRPAGGICELLAASVGITAPITFQQCASLLGLINAPTAASPMTTAAPTVRPPITSVCRLLAANLGIATPAALLSFQQQCAVLLGFISAPTTATPTTAAPVTGICQSLAANSGITEPAALLAFLRQCTLLTG